MDTPKRKTVKRPRKKAPKANPPKPGFIPRLIHLAKIGVSHAIAAKNAQGRFFYYKLLEGIIFWILAVYFCVLLLAGAILKLFDSDNPKNVADGSHLEKPHPAKKSAHKKRRHH